MMGIYDFHSHVLPGIDDGSKSVEESIAMLKEEAAQGICHVVATPHFYPRYDSPESFLKKRREAELRLREEMGKHTGLPELSVGAEVYYFSGISESDALMELTIAEKKCILIEMPQSPWPDSCYRELEAIYVHRGVVPIVAHIDRYIAPFRTHGIPRHLEKLPVLVQANASFFLSSATSRMAMRMLRKNEIHLLGSDAHNMRSRVPNLEEALCKIEKKLGQDVLRRIESYQSQILACE